MTIDFHVSGYCVADASIVNPTLPRKKISFHAAWLHIRHEKYGNILVDTGYTMSFFEATRSFPGKLYGWATPATIKEDETAVATLRRKGIAPEDINYIIITHFHADHVCALRDFPNARFICSRAAFEEAKRCNGISAVSKGILKELLPADFYDRVLLAEDIGKSKTTLEGGLPAISFFDETSIQFVHLPGHATGMLGLLIYNNGEQILYAADAQWDKAAFDADILPRKIVKLFFSSWSDFVDTTQKLKLYMAAHPQTRLMFTHCPETLKYVQ